MKSQKEKKGKVANMLKMKKTFKGAKINIRIWKAPDNIEEISINVKQAFSTDEIEIEPKAPWHDIEWKMEDAESELRREIYLEWYARLNLNDDDECEVELLGAD